MGMVSRLLHLLSAFALLFAMTSMTGGHAAFAMPAGPGSAVHDARAGDMAAGHCADMGQEREPPAGRSIDCTIACAMILGAFSPVAAPPLVMAQMGPRARAGEVSAHNPEYEPPPPRSL